MGVKYGLRREFFDSDSSKSFVIKPLRRSFQIVYYSVHQNTASDFSQQFEGFSFLKASAIITDGL